MAIGGVYLAVATIWATAVAVLTYAARTPLMAVIGYIFLLPLLLFYWNSWDLCDSHEAEMSRSGVLSIGIIVTVTLLNQLSANYTGPQGIMTGLYFASLILILLSVPDYYFGREYIALTRHVRIILQILGIGTIALAVTLHFTHRREGRGGGGGRGMQGSGGVAGIAAAAAASEGGGEKDE